MQNSQNSNLQKIPFIDFVPAEVKETTGDNWRIVFYVRKPGSDKLKRFRRRVKKLSGKQNRLRYAKRICAELNKKLENGTWSPFKNQVAGKEYKSFFEVMNLFIDQSERKYKDNLLRKDTFRSYTSYVKNIKKYMGEDMFTVEFNQKFIVEFLDHLYYTKKRSSRTSNNYLSFCSTLSIFMKERNFLTENPTELIKTRRVGKKVREIIPVKIRNNIFEYLGKKNPEYLGLCLTVYFCFIRRTEISKLQVKNLDLTGDTIFIPSNVSKNGKDGFVTVPKKLKILLAKHMDGFNDEDYLFSDENFKPGTKKLKPKKISDTWSKMRKELKFKNEYQFYSLKDTGITQLFLLQVPLIKIRDQARHHDIKITESYTPRNYASDETIKNLEFDFF